MSLSGEDIYIESTIVLHETRGSATLGLRLLPFQRDDSPEQWYRGTTWDLDAHDLPPDRHSELLIVARRQATAMSEKLRCARYDFTDTSVYGNIHNYAQSLRTN